MNKMIIKFTIVYYPIIQRKGLYIPKILAICVDKGQSRNAIKALSTFKKPLIVDDFMDEDKICKMLTNKRSQAVFCVLDTSKKKKSILDLFYTVASSGQINGKQVLALPVFIFEESFEDIDEKCFVTVVEGDWSHTNLPLSAILLENDEIEVAISSFDKNDDSINEIERVFNLAANLANIANPLDDFMNKSKDIIAQMISLDEEYHDWNGADMLFLYSLEKWQENHQAMVCELPNVYNVFLNNISNVFFYDEKYVYMKDDLFREIAEIITDMMPINTLKMALRDKEVLVAESKSSQYVVKMNYYKENGKPERKKMLRFDRSKLSKPGEMDIIDAMSL